MLLTLLLLVLEAVLMLLGVVLLLEVLSVESLGVDGVSPFGRGALDSLSFRRSKAARPGFFLRM